MKRSPGKPRDHIRPACWYDKCPIQDIAPDPLLNRQVKAFIDFECLELSPGAAIFQRKILKDSGLDRESPETFIELKSVVADYHERKAKEAGKKGKKR